jgi:hypothetical protein
VNPDLLVAVLCYSGDEAQVRHQLPSYLHHGAPVLILSPVDAPVHIDSPGVTNRTAGLSGWKGPHVAYKMWYHWQIMLEQPKNWFLIHEPDTLCLAPELPPELFHRTDVMWSNTDNPNGEGRMLSPPWLCHREVLERLVKATDERMHDWNKAWSNESGRASQGEGMGNSEMVSQACGDLGIEGAALPHIVWTYKESDRVGLLHAVSNGAIFIHGLKEPDTYDVLVKLREEYAGTTIRELAY